VLVAKYLSDFRHLKLYLILTNSKFPPRTQLPSWLKIWPADVHLEESFAPPGGKPVVLGLSLYFLLVWLVLTCSFWTSSFALHLLQRQFLAPYHLPRESSVVPVL
jgi:hypothetical protein